MNGNLQNSVCNMIFNVVQRLIGQEVHPREGHFAVSHFGDKAEPAAVGILQRGQLQKDQLIIRLTEGSAADVVRVPADINNGRGSRCPDSRAAYGR